MASDLFNNHTDVSAFDGSLRFVGRNPLPEKK